MGKLLFLHIRVANSKNSESQILIWKSLKISFLKWKLYNSELFERNVGMLDFVILDIDLPSNSYCLWSWYSWQMQADRYKTQFYTYKYLQEYKRPFSSCKPNEKWTHIVLTCYNESEKELFYMKLLIVDRVIRARLMSLWYVWSWF